MEFAAVWTTTRVAIGVLALVTLAGYFVLLGFLVVRTRPRRPDPGPAENESWSAGSRKAVVITCVSGVRCDGSGEWSEASAPEGLPDFVLPSWPDARSLPAPA